VKKISLLPTLKASRELKKELSVSTFTVQSSRTPSSKVHGSILRKHHPQFMTIDFSTYHEVKGVP